MTSIKSKKQSIIAGALISSAGIFIAKVIGLLYAIPFNDMLGSAVNVEYYGMTQQLYAYLLNVSQAGFPFAIATLIARYSAKEDYKTVLFVKKISSLMMISIGLLMCLLLIVFSSPLAHAYYAGAGDAATFRYALVGSSFALFFVPILSSIRGFYQGLKEMEIYSLSQVLEQMSNATFVLAASAIAIYIFNADRIWAVYFGVFATSVASIVAIIHLKFYDHKRMKEIRTLAKQQKVKSDVSSKQVGIELIQVAIPFMIVALLGYSDSIINTLFLPKGLQAHGYAKADISLISSTINYSVLKLMSIPMIIAPGFSSAIIPHIESARQNKDYQLIKKNIREMIEIALYVAIPVSLCLCLFAQPLIKTLFPPANLNSIPYAANILAWFSLVAFMNTVSPVVTNLLNACGLKKKAISNIFVQVVIKFVLSYFALKLFGYVGLVFTTLISMIVSIGLGIKALTKKYHLKWKNTIRRIIVIMLGCLGMAICVKLFELIGFNTNYEISRFAALIQLMISGLVSVIVYFGITYLFGLPQTLLHIDFNKILKKFKRG